MQNYIVNPGGKLAGTFSVPGDKSISHRAIMLGAVAEGVTDVSGFLEGEDALATMNAFRSLGVTIEGPTAGRVRIFGRGAIGLGAPSQPIDCGNSGTSMRLMAGLLAGRGLAVTLTGDASLSQRPMRRVTDPLALMGARIETLGEGGRPPLRIQPVTDLQGIDYVLPVASAQVKSALLLAGLSARGATRITEPEVTRDHSERMLTAFGHPVTRIGQTIQIIGGGQLQGTSIEVPGDISSAAFFLVGASIGNGSDLILTGVGINPTRTGVIEILRLMGASIEVFNQRLKGGEPAADLRVRSAQLRGITIPPALVPLAIDEFPALFVAAALAEGQTVLTGAAELRVKESDRIAVMAEGLQSLGVEAHPTPDGMVIEGRQDLAGATIDSHGDHRIAMSFALAALRTTAPVTILDCDNVATSFPGFVNLTQRMGLAIECR